MHNLDVRQAIKTARLMHYEVATALGVSEYTLCRWLRTELSDDKKQSIYSAIKALTANEATR